MQFSKTTFNSKDIRFVKSDEKIYVNPQDVYRSFETGLTKHSYRNFVLSCPSEKKGHFLYRELKCFVGVFQNEKQFADVLKVLNDLSGLEWKEQIEKTAKPKTNRKPKQTIAPTKERVTVTKVNPVNVELQKEVEGLRVKLSDAQSNFEVQKNLLASEYISEVEERVEKVERTYKLKNAELEGEVAALHLIQIENDELKAQQKSHEETIQNISKIQAKKIAESKKENDLKLSQIESDYQKQIDLLQGQIKKQNENKVRDVFQRPSIVMFIFSFCIICGLVAVYEVMVDSGNGWVFSASVSMTLAFSILTFTFSGKGKIVNIMGAVMLYFHTINLGCIDKIIPSKEFLQAQAIDPNLVFQPDWIGAITSFCIALSLVIVEVTYAKIIKK